MRCRSGPLNNCRSLDCAQMLDEVRLHMALQHRGQHEQTQMPKMMLARRPQLHATPIGRFSSGDTVQ